MDPGRAPEYRPSARPMLADRLDTRLRRRPEGRHSWHCLWTIVRQNKGGLPDTPVKLAERMVGQASPSACQRPPAGAFSLRDLLLGVPTELSRCGIRLRLVHPSATPTVVCMLQALQGRERCLIPDGPLPVR